MELYLTTEPPDHLFVHLLDGADETVVAVGQARGGAASITRAVNDAMSAGYGECFWPGLEGGQYWWMFRRDGDSMDVIAMWTRGGAALWEHVFRATENADFVRDRLLEETARLGVAS